MLPPVSESETYEPALGCSNCFVFEQCGGEYTRGRLDCFCAHCEPVSCSYLCPRSKSFPQVWRDTDGIDIKITDIRQSSTFLPHYVPLIQHGFSRNKMLSVPYAAVTTFDATRRMNQDGDMIRDAGRLREILHLDQSVSIIFSSIAPDNELERFWRDRKQRQLVEGIKSLRPAHIIAPNFSLFRDVPRLDNLANIKRSLICAEEFSKAGLSVIPYIMGITDRDWQRWADFLKEHNSIRMVCKEFQTGAKKKCVAQWHIEHLMELQERIGRSLHIVGIGGRRHNVLRRQPWNTTIIDSVPFMRTMHRKRLTVDGWENNPTPDHVALDDLLQYNIEAYAKAIGHIVKRRFPPRMPSRVIQTAATQLELQLESLFRSANAA